MSYHGHDIIKILIESKKIKLNGTIIEIGSERGQGSTELLASFAKSNKCHFITVDVVEETSKKAEKIVKKIKPSFNAACMKGEDFLNIYPRNDICLVYLDAFDIQYPKKPASFERKKIYEDNGLILSNENSWKMHLDCVKNCYNKVVDGGFIVFDDTWLDVKTKQIEGKGKTAVPFLLSNGYEKYNMVRANKSRVYILKKIKDKDNNHV